MKKNIAFPSLTPPQTERRPHADTRHDITRIDEYAWLRAENWQEVFRNPAALDPAIRSHLEAENAYQAALMDDTAELRKTLFAEMKGRIKEDDIAIAQLADQGGGGAIPAPATKDTETAAEPPIIRPYDPRGKDQRCS